MPKSNHQTSKRRCPLDGEEAGHMRVNYILRGMPIAAGNHSIEFKFDPDVVKIGSRISLASSILLGLLLFGGLFYEFKSNKNVLKD